MIGTQIKKGITILSNPQKAFHELYGRTFEEVFGDYLKLLVGVSIVSAVVNMIFFIGRAVYYDIFRSVDIQYPAMLNYALGRSTSVLFFYLFAGTFVLFLSSILLKPFFKKIKYVHFLCILFYAMTPLLLFGWIPFAPVVFVVWAGFLFFTGITQYKEVSVKTGSLEQRE